MILGCGYVGEALAREALACGMKVDALTRNPGTAARLREAGVLRVLEATLQSTSWHAHTQEHYDVVVNCVSSAGGGLEGYQTSYVEGMQSIVQWTRSQLVHLGAFVYTSSTGVYPQGAGQLVDESASLDPASDRGAILQEAERIIRQELPCERWFILRLAGIYGPGRHHLLDKLREGIESLPGSGEHTMNLIHRDDVVRALLTCAQTPDQISQRVYNLSDNHHATKRELMEWLACKLGREIPVFDATTSTVRSVPNRRIDSTRIQDELTWKPLYSSYREGYTAILQGAPVFCD